MKQNLATIIGGILGFAAFRYLGYNIILPGVGLIMGLLITATVPYFKNFHRFQKLALSALFGHLFWMGIAAIAYPQVAITIFIDLALFLAGCVVLSFRQPPPVYIYAIIGFELFAAGVNITQFNSNIAAALSAHLMMRLLFLLSIAIYLYERNKPNGEATEPATHSSQNK